MAADPYAIPREVWRNFVESGGLERVEPMRYHRPLTTIRLDPATAQEEADKQRQRFRRLIFELFPLDRVEAFIATHLQAGLYPDLQAFYFEAGLLQPFEHMLAHETEAVRTPSLASSSRLPERCCRRIRTSRVFASSSSSSERRECRSHPRRRRGASLITS